MNYEQPIRHEGPPPPPGSLIRMTRTSFPHYHLGDMAVIWDFDMADFRNLGNPAGFDKPLASVMGRFYLVVREGPEEGK